MKKIILLIILICAVPFSVKAKEKDLVKVYVFVSTNGFYSYTSEDAIKSLKSIDSYGKKFEIIEKEAYTYPSKYAESKEGKDFDLFKKVIEYYNSAGYDDYTYTQTPTIIVSDEYEPINIKETINNVYKNGDKDLVGCIESGEDNCSLEIKSQKKLTNKINIIIIFLGIFFLLMIFFLIYFIKEDKNIKKFKNYSN